MRLENENPHAGIQVGTLVMNYRHNLLRLGVVDSQRVDSDGWTYCVVHWLKDHIHQENTRWNKKMNCSFVEQEETRVDFLRPVTAGWLKEVLTSYEEYENDRRTEFS